METNLYLRRILFTDKSTIGELYWQGGEFECNTLEDTCRRRAGDDNVLQKEEKINGETAIPSGMYEIGMEFSSHFKRKMPYLKNVPLFDGVMIHWGNKPEDSLGCILLGQKSDSRQDWISSSQLAYNEFEKKLLLAINKGKVLITISGGYTA